jgi:hypothetical protein
MPQTTAPSPTLALVLLAAALPVHTHAEQTFAVTKISENANTRSDQRPIPIGFHDAGARKTFVSWMGANSTAVVKELDHVTGAWSPDKVVGVSPFVDKHNYPGMLRGVDGRLLVFYGCHNSTLRMTASPGPLSIEGEWEDRFIEEAVRASYPAPVITVDGTLYVFYRDTRKTLGFADDRPYQYVKSTDAGRTWTRHMAIDPFPRTTDNMCEVYNGKVSYQTPAAGRHGRIHLAWTIAGEKSGRHAHATYGRNLYYAWLDPANDHLFNIEGRDLGTGIDSLESDAHCLVLETGIPESGHLAGLQTSVHFRDNGFPVIHFDNRLAGGGGSATWTGAGWAFGRIENTGWDPREIEKCGPDSFRVYRPRGADIRVYLTTDAGLQWTLESTIAVGQAVDRCLVVDNFHPDAKLLVTEAGDGTITEAKRDVFIAAVTGGFEPPYLPVGTN